MATSIANPVKRLVAAMPEPLQTVCKKIQDQLQREAHSSIMSNYYIGLEIAKVQADEPKFGSGAVVKLSEVVGYSVHQLYSCQQLAQTWTKEELEKIIATPSVKGQPLSVSHLHSLARVREQPKFLAQLHRAALSEGLSSRDIDARIQMHNDGKQSSGGRPLSAPKSPISGLQQGSKLITSLVKHEAVYEEAIFAKIDSLDVAQVSEKLYDELLEAERRSDELLAFAKSYQRRIGVALSRVRSTMEVKAADAKPSRRGKGTMAPSTNGHEELEEGQVMPDRPPRRKPLAAKAPPAKATQTQTAKKPAKATPKVKGKGKAAPGKKKPAKKRAVPA